MYALSVCNAGNACMYLVCMYAMYVCNVMDCNGISFKVMYACTYATYVCTRVMYAM